MTKTDKLEGWFSVFAAEIIQASNSGIFNTQEGVHIFMRGKVEQLEEFLQQLKDDVQ